MAVAGICGQCSASNPPTNRFCGQCGAALAAQADTRERRLVESPEAPAVPDAGATSYELPDWLREPADPEQNVAQHPAERRQETQTSEPEMSTPIEPDLPAWLRISDDQPGGSAELGQANDEQSLTAPSSEMPPEIPAWLLADDHDPGAAGRQSSAQGTLPDTVQPWNIDYQDEADDTRATSDQTAASLRGPRPMGARPIETSDLPGWLRVNEAGTADEAHAPDPPPATSDNSAGAFPSWLTDNGEDSLQSSAISGANDTVAGRQPINTQTELPSWLQEEPSAASAMAERAAEESAPSGAVADDTLPDWLRASAFDPPTFEPSSPAAWLTDTAPEAPAAKPADLPARLHQPENEAGSSQDASGHVARTYEVDAAEALPEDSQATVAENDVPAWLVGLQPTTATPSTGLPSWLSDINAPSSTAFDEEVEVSAATPPDVTTGGLPPWLEGLDTPVTASEQSAPPQQSPQEGDRAENDFAGQLDLPAWLREPNADATAAVQPRSTPSWLQDLGGDEPSGADERTAVTPPARPAIERSAERRDAMQLLERILLEPAPEPVALPEPAQARRRFPIIPLLAFLLLIAIIIAILLNYRLPLGLGTPQQVAPGIEALAARIAALSAQSPVLVAYEMDARRVAELGALEENVLEPLLTRRVPLLLMTTDAQGALFARRRAGLLRERRDGYYEQPGLGFLDLGFKPGAGLALARMATNFDSVLEQDWTGRRLASEQPILTTLCGGQAREGSACRIEDLSMVVVLADEAEDVRLWIEQVASKYPTLPITFAVPAELEPIVQPYLTRPELAMVSGLDGAIALQRSRDLAGAPVDDWLARRADATSVGRAAFGAMVILGAVPAVWSGRRARARGKLEPWGR